MSARLPCPPAPGPLEAYAAHFDPLFCKLGQRRSFRAYLASLLLPRERNKTLTGLVGAEPIVQAQAGPVQRLQCFLSEARWEAEALNTQRLALLRADAATAPTAAGVVVIDETGDRKDGTKTAHVAHQYLGSLGKIANGIVAVSSRWADERVYYPLHVQPYTPARRLPRGKSDPAFRTKPQIAVDLVRAAQAGFPFRAVVADCIYGESPDFTQALWAADVPYVLSLRPSRGTWGPAEAAYTPREAAEELAWGGAERPGDWARVVRRFRDGHQEVWWAADLTLAGWGPDHPSRAALARGVRCRDVRPRRRAPRRGSGHGGGGKRGHRTPGPPAARPPAGRCSAGRWHSGGCAVGSTPGRCSGATGGRGRPRPRPLRSRPSLRRWARAGRCISTSAVNKLPLVHFFPESDQTAEGNPFAA